MTPNGLFNLQTTAIFGSHAEQKKSHRRLRQIEAAGGIQNTVLWLDSRVPQNRKSIMSFALINFTKNCPAVHSIQHKYCEPGHSSTQEVDNTHLQSENRMRFRSGSVQPG